MRIAYLINSGINLHTENSPLIRIKYILNGLRESGHIATFKALDGRQVIMSDDWDQDRIIHLAITGCQSWNFVESIFRRMQGILHFPYMSLFDSIRFYEACRRNLHAYDILFEHFGLLSWGGIFASKQLRIPRVLDVEADLLDEQKYLEIDFQGLQKLYALLIIRINLKSSIAITVVSSALKQHLVHKWGVPPEKIFVLPNGVDTHRFKPDSNAYYQMRSQLGIYDEVLVTFIGYFYPWHGIEHLIEAFRMALQHTSKVKLLLIGDGTTMPKIKEMIRSYHLSESVILTGAVDHASVPRYLNASDICVAPYPELKSELWFSPMKIYEYMAAGKAIIASRAGQISDVIRNDENGWLVEPGNIQQLATSIVALSSNDEKRCKLGAKARDDALKYYSWQSCVENLESIFSIVLEEKTKSKSNNLKRGVA